MRTPLKTLASLFLCLLFAAPLFGQTQDDRVVRVTGEGIVRVDPDQVTVTFGIITWADDPQAARAQNADAAARAMNALRALDIPDEQLQLKVLRLQPRYEYDEETRNRRRVGYEAIRQVEVILNDLELLPQVIAEIVEEGANELDGIHYGLQDDSREEARNDALREAAVQAREKARLLARVLGADLGMLQEIVEESYSGPRPFAYENVRAMAEAAVADQSVPDAFAAGQVEVRAQVRVVFSLQ